MEQAASSNKPEKKSSKFLIRWRDALIHFLCISPLLVVIVLVGLFFNDNGYSNRKTLAIILSVIICTIITFVVPQIMMAIKDRKNKRMLKENKTVI
ncbi:hypothetical protein FACS1894218_6380 [Bacilli bacterium]|nr:hypothetical protein FACS1894218_6380 [Bacilli bacterium]